MDDQRLEGVDRREQRRGCAAKHRRRSHGAPHGFQHRPTEPFGLVGVVTDEHLGHLCGSERSWASSEHHAVVAVGSRHHVVGEVHVERSDREQVAGDLIDLLHLDEVEGEPDRRLGSGGQPVTPGGGKHLPQRNSLGVDQSTGRVGVDRNRDDAAAALVGNRIGLVRIRIGDEDRQTGQYVVGVDGAQQTRRRGWDPLQRQIRLGVLRRRVPAQRHDTCHR